MSRTSIEWAATQNPDGSFTAGEVWNCLRGCSRISPGCGGGAIVGPNGERGGCYAEAIAARFSDPGAPFHGYATRTDKGPRWTGKVTPLPEKLSEPLKRRRPTTWFVNSMSDLFHEDVPDDYIAAVFGVMAACPQHTFQILTKRAERLPQWFEWVETLLPATGKLPASACLDFATRTLGRHEIGDWSYGQTAPWPLPNVHLGVSVEDRKHGLPRIDHLRAAPAAVRFLSIEPLLEDLGEIDLTGIGWVIVGGESGQGARPMNVNWIRRVMWNCRAQKVPVFVKQLGANPHNGLTTLRVRSKGGDMAEWPEDLRVREMPRTP